jgi:hypothetical protein
MVYAKYFPFDFHLSYIGNYHQQNQKICRDTINIYFQAELTFAPSSSSSSSSGLYVSANTDFRRDENRVTGGSVEHAKFIRTFNFSHTSYIF